jgi:hypothetical protein
MTVSALGGRPYVAMAIDVLIELTPTRWIVTGALLIALSLTRPGEAQENRVPEAQVESPEWRMSFTPYLWSAALDGSIGLNGEVTDVSLGLGDIIEEFDLGFVGLFEARRTPWVLRADVLYRNLGHETNGITVNQDQFILQPEVGRTVVAQPWGSVDLLAGVRYWNLSVDVTAPPNTTSGSKDWVDATAGAVWRFEPGRRWHLFVKGDVGGGGAKFSWQGHGGAGYDLGPCCTLSASYRYLDVDYEEADAFIYDVHFNGPALGLTLHF